MKIRSVRRRRTLVSGAVAVAAVCLAAPQAGAFPPEIPKKLVAEDFPDPDIVRVGDTWYAYATNNWRHVPVASAPTIDGPWVVNGDAMPGGPSPAWARSGRTWAPDVHHNPDGTLTLTYTAWHAASGRQCIGTATATDPLGPFTPAAQPLICPLGSGGAIDANTFVANDGTRYLLWKNDGNAIGQPSTLWLTRTANNGTSVVGGNTALMTRSGVIEAPDMVQRGGQFVLFYSGGDYGGCGYTTSYATASTVAGPFTDAGPLMTQGNTGICGPGGADVVHGADGLTGGDKVVFHGWVNGARHLYSIDLSWVGNVPVQGGRRAASLDGDGRSEIAAIGTDGDIDAFYNYGGFATMPFGNSVVIATEVADPERVRFADLDDDGRAELIYIQADGQVRAWHNDGAFSTTPYGASVIIGDGFTDPARTLFTDLDGDGRDEIAYIRPGGDVEAFYNYGGFAAMPFGNSVVVGQGFTEPERTRFADLDVTGGTRSRTSVLTGTSRRSTTTVVSRRCRSGTRSSSARGSPTRCAPSSSDRKRIESPCPVPVGWSSCRRTKPCSRSRSPRWC